MSRRWRCAGGPSLPFCFDSAAQFCGCNGGARLWLVLCARLWAAPSPRLRCSGLRGLPAAWLRRAPPLASSGGPLLSQRGGAPPGLLWRGCFCQLVLRPGSAPAPAPSALVLRARARSQQNNGFVSLGCRVPPFCHATNMIHCISFGLMSRTPWSHQIGLSCALRSRKAA